MYAEKIVPVDLKQKRKAAGITQQELANRFGVERETIVRAENGSVSVSFPLALQYARAFGSITIKQGNETFVLSLCEDHGGPDRDRIPDDEELHDLNDVEHNLNVMQQAEDVVRAIQRLVSSPLLLRSDSELSDALRIAKYKELFELDWAVRGRIREGVQLHPHLVDEGLRRALADRPGAKEEEEDVGSAA